MSVEIVKGEDKTLTIDVKDANGDAYDLTGFTELEAEFTQTSPLAKLTLSTVANGNGSVVTSPNPTCGKIQIDIKDPDTLNLESGDNQDLEIIITDAASEKTILQLSGQLKVKERLIS